MLGVLEELQNYDTEELASQEIIEIPSQDPIPAADNRTRLTFNPSPVDRVERPDILDVKDKIKRDRNMYKRWMFTINNPGDYKPIFIIAQMAYMVYQLESGELHTPHYQGYVRFRQRKRMSAVKKFFTKETHLEKCWGNEQECKEYCTKEDTRIAEGEEFGIFISTAGNLDGFRSDLAGITTDCLSGRPMTEIAIDYPADFIRYHQGIQACHDLLAPQPPAIRQVQCLVLWGPTGTGKSYRMANEYPEAYKVKPGRGPWDGYRSQDVVWFDEFNWEMWPIFDMNDYLDQYLCPLPCRYHDRFAVWTKVVICSNSDPLTWYRNADLPVVNALRRRLAANCRHITSRTQDIAASVPEPDFSYLVPPPFDPNEQANAIIPTPVIPSLFLKSPSYHIIG